MRLYIKAPLCTFMKTVGKTDVYLPLLRVTGIFFNMTGNVNLQDFTTVVSIPIFLILDFKNLVISLISNKISVGVYEIWQQLVTPQKSQASMLLTVSAVIVLFSLCEIQ